jgi:predicted nucleic acid-binding protein
VTVLLDANVLIALLVDDHVYHAAAENWFVGLDEAHPRHEFWPDDVPYTDVPVPGIVGHRQVTDAYLAQLARAHRSRLATFDQAIAKLHHDVADLVPDRAIPV